MLIIIKMIILRVIIIIKIIQFVDMREIPTLIALIESKNIKCTYTFKIKN